MLAVMEVLVLTVVVAVEAACSVLALLLLITVAQVVTEEVAGVEVITLSAAPALLVFATTSDRRPSCVMQSSRMASLQQ